MHPLADSVCAAILVSPYDLLFGKGAIASVRHFAPRLPIVVIADGQVDLTPAVKAYGVKVVRKEDYQNAWLRRYGAGFGVAKMALFWECPYEKFLYFDSDAVLWGDPTQTLLEMNDDVIIDIPDRAGRDADDALRWFFDDERLRGYFPDFPAAEYWNQYFCTGAFIARRNSLPLSFYQELFEVRRRDPLVFRSRGEMGMLNFLLFKLWREEKIRLRRVDFQTLFTEFPRELLHEKYPSPPAKSVVAESDLGFRVLHMPDQKPLVDSSQCYSAPMTHFRLKYLADTTGLTGEAAIGRLREEDANYPVLRQQFLRQDLRQKVGRLLLGDRGEWVRVSQRILGNGRRPLPPQPTGLARQSPRATPRTGLPQFGIVLVASCGDWLFAKGCIASIRRFMPTIPITVLLDGAVDTSFAQRTYGIHILRQQDIDDAWLRQNSFGWGITKMVAAWHSPYERYLHLDADTVVWGDLSAKVFDQNVDVIWSKHEGDIKNARTHCDTWYFNPAMVEARWSGFPWKNYLPQFACTGTYMMRTDCLSQKRYKQMIEEGVRTPGLFHFGEMGMLNLMVFEEVHQGRLRMERRDFQVICPDHSLAALHKRFRFVEGAPVVTPGDEQVLHMPDQKPLANNAACFHQPMTYFRLEYLRATEGLPIAEAWHRIRIEDQEFTEKRNLRQHEERLKRIRGLLTGESREWKRAAMAIKRKVGSCLD